MKSTLFTYLFLFCYIHANSGPFAYKKYVHYDYKSPLIQAGQKSNSYSSNIYNRDEYSSRYDRKANVQFFVKRGCGNHKISKPFVFVEDYFKRIVLTDGEVRKNANDIEMTWQNFPEMVTTFNSVPSNVDNQSFIGYSTFNWGTLVSGVEVEGLMDGDPLHVQKSPDLLNALYDYGYDIIFVDFQSGQNFMENNGYALSKVLKDIKDSLDNNGSTEKLVVCGASMGGLVSRFAIRDLELNGANKYKNCVGKFISFDSPQMGANINLGMQYFVQNLSRLKMLPVPNLGIDLLTSIKKAIDEIDGRYDKLTCPSASQLVLYSCLADPIDWYSPMKYTTASQSMERMLFNLHPNASTWPSNCRKYSIINGSRNGDKQNNGNVQSCETMFDGDGVFSLDIQSLPNYNDGYCKIYDFELAVGGLCGFSFPSFFTGNSVRVRESRGVDNVAGSYRSDFSAFSDFNHWLSSALAGLMDPCQLTSSFSPGTTQAPNYCFIPALSAAGVKNFEALVENSHVALPQIFQGSARFKDPNHAVSHFDVVYAPQYNQTHVEITDENISWVMQILLDLDGPQLLFQNEIPEARVHSAGKTIRAGYNVGKFPACSVTNFLPPACYTTINYCGNVILQPHVQTIFRAGERISLEPGFSTAENSSFVAEIMQYASCGNSVLRVAPIDNLTNANKGDAYKTTASNDDKTPSGMQNQRNRNAPDKHKKFARIFPNPTRDHFVITASEPITQFSMYDISGKLILKQENVGTSQHEVSTENLLAGIYFVNINTAGQNETLKLVIEK